MGRASYFLAWFGGCVSIGTFAMGSSVVGTLNLIQATLAIAIGCFVIGIALALNGAAGYKYGIPFMVQARSALALRVPACRGWFAQYRQLCGTAFKAGLGPAR